MLFLLGDDGNITQRFASYFGARLLTHEWLQPGDGVHEIYPAASNVLNERGEELVTAYAVKRPDRLWAIMLINKDPIRTFSLQPVIKTPIARQRSYFNGRVDIYQYSREQYALGGTQGNPHPVKADEPEHRFIGVRKGQPLNITLPPFSLTIIRGRLEP
jgi:hypothetical protein